MKSCRLENEALSPSSSAINSLTWYIQITNTNSVTKAIQPISLRVRTVAHIAPTEIGCPRLAPAAHLIEPDRDERADHRKHRRQGRAFPGELNAIHAFREGNGRSQVTFFALLADHAGHPLKIEKLKPDEMLAAMIASFDGHERLLAKVIHGLIE